MDIKVAREKSYDLYILPDINVPWVNDGVRLAEDTKWFHDRLVLRDNSIVIPNKTNVGSRENWRLGN